MKRISSYQRRLRSIKFYKQRGRDLEDIIVGMGKELKKNNLPIFWGKGVKGDGILNDIDSGDFAINIMSRIEQELWEETK